ncbi:MAG: MCP four helix bundle domain-containing protein, partial [Chloroflexi bacterium]|nr:MCP four helix bundle domain-containing protein [Chloroflexota bacterium]
MNTLNNVKVGVKLIGGFLIVAGILVALATFGVVNMNSMQARQDTLYNDRLLPIEQLGAAMENSAMIRGDLYKFILIPEQRAAVEQSIPKEIEQINNQMKLYRATYLLQAEKDGLAKFDPAWAAYQAAVADAIKQVKAGNERAAIQSLIDGELHVARTNVQNALDDLSKVNVDEAARLDKESDAESSNARTMFIVATVIGLLFAVGLGIVLSRSITVPLGKGVTMMQEMAKGHLGMRLKMERKDEVGLLAHAMDQFADDLQNIVIGTMKKISNGDLSAEVGVKDNQDEISPALIGTTLSLRGLVAETKMLTKAAVDGKLATRADVSKFQGDYRAVLQGVNDTLDAVIGPLNVAAEYVDRISKGDVPAKITDKYNGDFNEIKNNLNQCIDAVNLMIADANMLSKAAVEGKLA